jgi:hypothetical protein
MHCRECIAVEQAALRVAQAWFRMPAVAQPLQNLQQPGALLPCSVGWLRVVFVLVTCICSASK